VQRGRERDPEKTKAAYAKFGGRLREFDVSFNKVIT
jgi:hypothetical protein